MRIIKVDRGNPSAAAIEEAAQAIGKGALVILPTDTVYGLAADPRNREALERIHRIKRRPEGMPLAVIAAGLEQVWPLVEGVSAEVERVIRESLPGPVTLVLKRSAAVPEALARGRPTVGVRVPACKVAIAIAARAGPYAATSANLTGDPAPQSLDHVSPVVLAEAELALDAGPCPIGRPSAVVDLTGAEPVVLRPGPEWTA